MIKYLLLLQRSICFGPGHQQTKRDFHCKGRLIFFCSNRTNNKKAKCDFHYNDRILLSNRPKNKKTRLSLQRSPFFRSGPTTKKMRLALQRSHVFERGKQRTQKRRLSLHRSPFFLNRTKATFIATVAFFVSSRANNKQKRKGDLHTTKRRRSSHRSPFF